MDGWVLGLQPSNAFGGPYFQVVEVVGADRDLGGFIDSR
jgi:hypothetical protein